MNFFINFHVKMYVLFADTERNNYEKIQVLRHSREMKESVNREDLMRRT